jgi:hypothetical protein
MIIIFSNENSLYVQALPQSYMFSLQTFKNKNNSKIKIFIKYFFSDFCRRMAAERKEGARHLHREQEQVSIDYSLRINRILGKRSLIKSSFITEDEPIA